MLKMTTIFILMISTLLANLTLLASESQCSESLYGIKKHPKTYNKQDTFKLCLSEYIQIPTLTLQGHEYKAAPFFQTIFQKLNIPYKEFWTKDTSIPQGRRYNVIATLPVSRKNNYAWNRRTSIPSIVLLNHIDIIDAHDDQWLSKGLAFSGQITTYKGEEFLWGRGALDMKSIAIMQLMAFVEASLENKKRTHDIHFLAVGGEESNGSGAKGAISLMQPGGELEALGNAKILLNEGGGGLYLKKIGKNLVAIDAEQKGGAWLSIKNSSLDDLLFQLSLWHILELKKLKLARAPSVSKCILYRSTTPKAKVNVNPSKFVFELKCPSNLSLVIKTISEAVIKNYPEISFSSQVKTNHILEVTVETQSSGHGSLKKGQGLIDKSLSILYSLGMLNTLRLKASTESSTPVLFENKMTPASEKLIKTLSEEVLPLKALYQMSFIPYIKNILLNTMSDALKIANAFKTSCNFTNLNYNNDQSYAEAYIDCRLVHTYEYPNTKNHAEIFIQELKDITPFIHSQIDMISGWSFSTSSVSNPYLLKMISTLKEQNPDSLISPFMNIAGSDSTWFRAPSLVEPDSRLSSIPSYGYIPFIYTQELISTIHGSNERFPVNQIDRSITNYTKLVKELAFW